LRALEQHTPQMSPYRSRTPWVVLLVFVVAVTGLVVTALLWKSPASAAPVAEAAEPELPPLPSPPANHTRRTNKKKTHTAVARRAPAPPPIEPAQAPLAPVAAPAVAEAAPAPVTDPEVATEPAPVQEPFSAPPLLNTEPPAAAPAPAPEPEPTAVETAEAPLTFDGNGEEIARAIAKAKRREVQRCFEHELKRAPTLHGTVNVELELAPPQQVTAVRVSDDLERPELTACVTQAMQRLSFTGLNEEISVRVPYVLTARGK
jgi:outer membrane biosynthesis protein TonB